MKHFSDYNVIRIIYHEDYGIIWSSPGLFRDNTIFIKKVRQFSKLDFRKLH